MDIFSDNNKFSKTYGNNFINVQKKEPMFPVIKESKLKLDDFDVPDELIS